MKNNLQFSRIILLTIFSISFFRLSADNYFWVGGTGSWNDYAAHWATASGGQIFHEVVPTPDDTVIFDSLSFAGTNDTVFADSSVIYCYNLKWLNVQGHPVFENSLLTTNTILKIFGSISLDTGMTWSYSGIIRFYGLDSGNTILSNGKYFSHLEFCGDTIGSWTLLDSLNAGSLAFTTGIFNSAGQTIHCGNFTFSGNNHADVLLDTSYVTMSNIDFESNALHFDADSSIIKYSGYFFRSNGQHYGKIIFTTDVEINGVNQFEECGFEKNCSILTDNTFRKIIFNDTGIAMTMTNGIHVNVIDTLIINGSCRSLNAIFAPLNGVAYLVKQTGSINLDHIVLENISTSGSASFLTSNSVVNGNSNGWNISAPLISRTLFWVGGTGDWNDSAHWSATSGGMGGECPPTPVDDVYLDNLSFPGTGFTVNSSLDNIFCHSLHWTDIFSQSTLNNSYSVFHIYGDFQINNFMNEVAGKIIFRNPAGMAQINSAAQSLADILFFGNGSWNIQDTLNSYGSIMVDGGIVNTNGFPINCGIFSMANPSMQFNGSTVHCSSWSAGNSVNIASSPSEIVTWYMNDETGATFPKVIFPNGGDLFSNDFFGSVTFNGDAYIGGNNTYDSLQFLKPGTEIQLFPGSNQIINNLFSINSNCAEMVMLHTSTEGAQATISKYSGAINLSDIILEDISANGSASFNAFFSVAIANVNGWNITPPPPGNFYWIGGTGNWNDPNHWSLSSGGSAGSCVPNPTTDVIFDANSFLSAADSVKVNVAYSYCHNMTWTGIIGTPSLIDAHAGNLTKCYGSFILDTNVIANQSTIEFRSVVQGNTINGNDQSIGKVAFDGYGGSWILTGNLRAGKIEFNTGDFKTAGFNVVASIITTADSAYKTIELDSSIIFVSSWKINGPSFINLDASNAKMFVDGVDFYGGGGQFYNDITFTGDVHVWDNDTLSFARFTKMVWMNGDNIFDTLFFDNAGSQVSFQSGSTQTINGNIFASGTSGFPIGIESSQGFIPATFFKTANTVCLNFLNLNGIAATGGATFYAGDYSTNVSNNSGWIWQGCSFVMDTMWPGDANSDLVCDNIDLLNIGIAFGETGPARANASNNWIAQGAFIWNRAFANTHDIKSADSDGDGVVWYSDTTAVNLNYGLTHPARFGPPDTTLATGTRIYFTTPLTAVNAGDTTSLGIMLGDMISPAQNVYGIAFTLNYNNPIVSGSAWMDFNNSWLAPAGYEIHLLHEFNSQNKMDIAISRIDHQNFSGQGEIARLHFRLDPSAQGGFKCWYSNVTLIDYSEIQFPVQYSYGVFPIASGINEISQNGFHAYPNPTNGNYFINDSKLSGVNSVIEICDVAGRIIQKTKTEGENSVTLHLENLPAGTYIVRIVNENGIFVERVVKN